MCAPPTYVLLISSWLHDGDSIPYTTSTAIFPLPKDSKVLWKCAPVHPVVLRLPEQSLVHEGGFAAAVGHKLGPKLLEALAEAHGKQNPGFKHVQNGSNMFHLCRFFFSVFESCGKWAQSGQHRDNRMPVRKCKTAPYHTSAHDAKLGSCHQLVATPKRSHSWVLWHSNSMTQPIASHGHHKCRFYADNQRTSKNCGFLSAIVALLWYILIHCRLLGKKEAYRNRSGWCWKTDECFSASQVTYCCWVLPEHNFVPHPLKSNEKLDKGELWHSSNFERWAMPSCAIFWWAKLQIVSGTFLYPGTNLRRVALRPGQNTPTQQYACDWSKTNKCHHLSVDYVNLCQFTTAVDLDMLNQCISSYRLPEWYLTHQKSSKHLQHSAIVLSRPET